MIPGETVRTGAEWPGTPLRILQSNAGWYLGYLDRFGEPYTRETHYYPDRASEEWGMPGWVGAMVRATDKVRRLQSYARNGELVNEGVEDAFMDLAVYALIALVLWEEGEQP